MITLNEIIRNQLDVEQKLSENSGEITPEIEALISQNETDLVQKTDNIRYFIQKTQSDISFMKNEIDFYQAKIRSLTNLIEWLKSRGIYAMDMKGVNKIQTNSKHTLYIRESVILDIDKADVENLPDEFVKVTRLIKKQAIKDYHKQTGLLPEGVQLIPNKSLIIK